MSAKIIIKARRMDVDEPEDVSPAPDDDEHDLEVDGDAVLSAPRKRGRPKGRGKGTSTSGTATPRGIRGRGRGRGRIRARGSLTIKLPRKGDGEDGDEGADGDNEADGADAEDDYYVAKPQRKIQGANYTIDGDEFVTDDDPKGDEKIDNNGNLLGGRRFKATTFILPSRDPERKYMLAIDAARTSGFRDSLYYFRRNLLALKLNATQPEKDYLIAEGKLGSHLRTRSVTLITARSAYKLHGAKMILDGRWVTDDYYEEKVLAEITEKGIKADDLVGELPDPTATHQNAELAALGAAGGIGGGGGKADRAAGTSSGIYRAGGPTTIFGGTGWGPYSDGPLNAVRKSLLSRDGVVEENWMWMMAARVRESDEEWAKWRQESRKVPDSLEEEAPREEFVPVEPPPMEKKRTVGFETDAEAAASSRPLGIYEPHSHLIHYRADTQPTSAKWIQMPDSHLKRSVLGGTKVGNGAWGLAWIDTVMDFPTEEDERERLVNEAFLLETPSDSPPSPT